MKSFDKKNHTMRYLIIVVVAMVLTVGMYGIINNNGRVLADKSATETIKDAKDDMEKLKQEKEKLLEELDVLEQEKKDIFEYIKSVDGKIDKLTKKIVNLEADIKNRKLEIKSLKKEIKKTENIIAVQYETMKKRIKYMYEHGNAEYIDIILSFLAFFKIVSKVKNRKRDAQIIHFAQCCKNCTI